MADGITTNYSFTLPEVGFSNDTWGTKLNANWTAIDSLLKTANNSIAAVSAVANAALPATIYTAADVLAKVKAGDGAGSGLDADLLDGIEASAFMLTSAFTASAVRTLLLSVDGSGSLIDADMVDGREADWLRDWNNLLNRPATFASTWGLLSGIPSTFPPSAHTHGASDISTAFPVTSNAEGMCVTLPGGFKIQTGTVTAPANSSGTFTLPVPFTTSYRVVVSPAVGNPSAGDGNAVWADVLSFSQITVGSDDTARAVNWIAVGV